MISQRLLNMSAVVLIVSLASCAFKESHPVTGSVPRQSEEAAALIPGKLSLRWLEGEDIATAEIEIGPAAEPGIYEARSAIALPVQAPEQIEVSIMIPELDANARRLRLRAEASTESNPDRKSEIPVTPSVLGFEKVDRAWKFGFQLKGIRYLLPENRAEKLTVRLWILDDESERSIGLGLIDFVTPPSELITHHSTLEAYEKQGGSVRPELKMMQAGERRLDLIQVLTLVNPYATTVNLNLPVQLSGSYSQPIKRQIPVTDFQTCTVRNEIEDWVRGAELSLRLIPLDTLNLENAWLDWIDRKGIEIAIAPQTELRLGIFATSRNQAPEWMEDRFQIYEDQIPILSSCNYTEDPRGRPTKPEFSWLKMPRRLTLAPAKVRLEISKAAGDISFGDSKKRRWISVLSQEHVQFVPSGWANGLPARAWQESEATASRVKLSAGAFSERAEARKLLEAIQWASSVNSVTMTPTALYESQLRLAEMLISASMLAERNRDKLWFSIIAREIASRAWNSSKRERVLRQRAEAPYLTALAHHLWSKSAGNYFYYDERDAIAESVLAARFGKTKDGNSGEEMDGLGPLRLNIYLNVFGSAAGPRDPWQAMQLAQKCMERAPLYPLNTAYFAASLAATARKGSQEWDRACQLMKQMIEKGPRSFDPKRQPEIEIEWSEVTEIQRWVCS